MGCLSVRAASSEQCVSNDAARLERLALLGLDAGHLQQAAALLQERVIRPNAEQIIDRFYQWLAPVSQFQLILVEHSTRERLRVTMQRYLLSLGVNFSSSEYFDERRRVGRVHQRIGVSHSLYQCAFRHLQELLIASVPPDLQQDLDTYNEIISFIIKITALDMSLATESFCDASLTGLQHSLEDQRGESERLLKLSYTDRLTELHNHSYSRHCLEVALKQAKEGRHPLCAMMADLDHFKDVNDSHGHLVGDEVLRIAAARMLSAARNGDELGRYGGEEFIFILQNTCLEESLEVAERVREHLDRDAIRYGGNTIHVTLSIGVAEARPDDTVNSLLERADEALYAAKAAGRNCICVAGQH